MELVVRLTQKLKTKGKTWKKEDEVKKMENKRFKLIRSKHRNSSIVFDKLLDDACIEIATNNRQMNDLMGKACMIILSADPDFLKLVEEW